MTHPVGGECSPVRSCAAAYTDSPMLYSLCPDHETTQLPLALRPPASPTPPTSLQHTVLLLEHLERTPSAYPPLAGANLPHPTFQHSSDSIAEVAGKSALGVHHSTDIIAGVAIVSVTPDLDIDSDEESPEVSPKSLCHVKQPSLN